MIVIGMVLKSTDYTMALEYPGRTFPCIQYINNALYRYTLSLRHLSAHSHGNIEVSLYKNEGNKIFK